MAEALVMTALSKSNLLGTLLTLAMMNVRNSPVSLSFSSSFLDTLCHPSGCVGLVPAFLHDFNMWQAVLTCECVANRHSVACIDHSLPSDASLCQLR